MPIHHRHHGEDDDHREHHTKANDYAHGHPKRVAGDDHRQHTQGSGGRGEENGPHTAATSLHGGFLGGHALLGAERLGIFIHNDAVSHDDTNQADDTQQGSHAEVEAEEPFAKEGAEHAQSAGTQGENGQIQLFEIGNQEHQKHQNGSNQALQQLRDDAGVER